jgi:hypothetical protein
MAGVTYAGGTFTTTAGNKTFVATPAVGDLIVVVTACTGLAPGSTNVIDNNSSGTYALVGTSRTGFSTTGLLQVWIRTSFITAASSTTFTAQQASSTGGGLLVYRVSGMLRTGTAALRSDGGQSSAAAGTPAPVLNQAPLTGNPVIAAVANGTSPATLTPRTGFTEAADLGYATPTTGVESCFRASGETSATLTFGSASASQFASIAVELDTSALPGPSVVAFEGAWADATSPHDIVVTGALNGDWLVRISGGDGGLSGGGNSVTASAFSTTVGSTGAWTDIEKSLPSGGGTGWLHVAAAQVTADGDVTVRATRTQAGTARAWGGVILRCRNSSGIGVHGFVGQSATEVVNLAGISQDSVIGFISVDWDAGTPATGYTPAGANDVERANEAGNYTVHCAYWTAQPSGTRDYGTDGTTASANLVSAAVEIKAASSGTPVGKDLGLVWNTRAAIGDPLQLVWNTRASIGDPLQLVWNTRVAIGDTLQAVWNVRAAVGKDVQFLWNTRQAVAKDLQLLWNVQAALTAVGKDLGLVWNVRQAVGDTVQLVWNTRQSLGDTLDLRWNVRAALAKDLSLLWNVRAAVGDPLQLVWNTRSAVGDPLQLVWNTRAALGDNLQLVWNTRQAVGKPLSLSWDVQALGLVAVGKDLGLVWNTRQAIGDTVALRWNVRTTIGDDLSLRWNTRAVTGEDLTLRWATRSLVGSTLDLRWGTRITVGKSGTYLWDVRSVAGKDLVLLWNVIGTAYDPIIDPFSVLRINAAIGTIRRNAARSAMQTKATTRIRPNSAEAKPQ